MKKHTKKSAAKKKTPAPIAQVDATAPYKSRIAQLEAFIENGLKTASWDSTEATRLIGGR